MGRAALGWPVGEMLSRRGTQLWRCLTPLTVARVVAILYVVAFLVLPLASVLAETVWIVLGSGPPLPDGFTAYLLRVTANSLYLASLTAALALLFAVPLALFLSKIDTPFRRLFSVLIVLPLITPPFISGFATVLLFGKTGVITQLLSRLGVDIVSIYGLPGLLLTHVAHFLPLAALTISAGLRVIPSNIEEAAISLGGRAPGIIVRILLPYVGPHLLMAFALVFLSSFGDVGAPLLLGGNFLVLQLETYTSFVSVTTDQRVPIILSGWTILISIVLLYVVRVLMRRTEQEHAFSTVRMLHRNRGLRWTGFVYCSAVIGSLLLPYGVITLSSFSTVWGASLLPEALTLRNYAGLGSALGPLKSSLILSAVATPICVVLAVLVGEILHRFPRRAASLDYVTLLPFVLPGVIIGIGLTRVYSGLHLLGAALPLAGTWVLLAISYSVRRLPPVLRVMVAGYSRLDRSLEESSLALGASRTRTFLRITLPQLIPAVSVAMTIAFIRIISELGSTLVLYPPGWETLAVAIFQLADEGYIALASAVSILMVVLTVGFTALSVLDPSRLIRPLSNRRQVGPTAEATPG